MLRLMLLAFAFASTSALLTGSRVALAKGKLPAHPLVLKQTIADLAAGKKNGLKCTPAEAGELDEIICMLEAQNPTTAPAESPLLDGTWKLLYTTTKGGSAGKLGPLTGNVLQVFSYDDGCYSNVLKIPPIRATLDAHWEVMDQSRWKVIFDRITFRILGLKVASKPFPPSQNGVWRMTYLDDSFRVLRASGSNTPEEENVYVLVNE